MANWIRIGALLAALAVALGAFAAHGLKPHLSSAALAIYHKAAYYQMVHALALVAVGLLAQQRPSLSLRISGWAFLSGILLFSGSLYLLSVTALSWLGLLTPLGGLAFILGWLALASAAHRRPPSHDA